MRFVRALLLGLLWAVALWLALLLIVALAIRSA